MIPALNAESVNVDFLSFEKLALNEKMYCSS